MDTVPMTPEARALRVLKLEGPKLEKLVRAATNLVHSRDATVDRREEILAIAGKVSRAITPHTACARGCSSCCHMAMNLSGHEARAIGRFVGREPASLGREGEAQPGLADELRLRYAGVPCPFLEAGRCSIYAVRPLACRLHHTMAEDDANCLSALDEQGRALHPTPALNLEAIQRAAAAIFTGEDFGDIREYFPAG